MILSQVQRLDNPFKKTSTCITEENAYRNISYHNTRQAQLIKQNLPLYVTYTALPFYLSSFSSSSTSSSPHCSYPLYLISDPQWLIESITIGSPSDTRLCVAHITTSCIRTVPPFLSYIRQRDRRGSA